LSEIGLVWRSWNAKIGAKYLTDTILVGGSVADDVHRSNIGVQTYNTYQSMYVRSYLGNKYMGLAE